MPLSVFNGSYIGKKNTGLGVVSTELISSIPPEISLFLNPIDNEKIGSLKIPSNLSPDYGFKGHMRRLFWIQNSLPRIMRRLGVDLLFSPLPEAPLFSSVRSIILAHDLLPIRFPQFSFLLPYYLTYVPTVIHQAELVLCNSYATANELYSVFRVPKEKLIPIKLGFNRKNFYPTGKPREDFFLVLGRHNPHKNLSRVIKSFALIKGLDCKLIFVGPFDSRYTPALRKLAGEIGIGHKCEWLDWVSDKQRLDLLNRCRGLIIASLWEGFGLPALEAMACGATVIASDRGALPEVVGDAGLYVNPLSCKSISEAITLAARDDSLIRDLELNGPKQAESFDWSTTSKEIQRIIISKA